MFDKLISYSSEYITQSFLKGGWNQDVGGGVTGRAEELPSTQLTDQHATIVAMAGIALYPQHKGSRIDTEGLP